MSLLWGLHVSLVVLSLSLFIWRGISMWQGRELQSLLWKRRIPDAIDSSLLLSGVALAYTLGFAPWSDNWLLTKLVALVVYILLGYLALRESAVLPVRRASFVLALCTAAYIITVAYHKAAIPWHSH